MFQWKMLQTRTFWAAVLFFLTATVNAVFGEGDHIRPLKDILGALLSDPAAVISILGMTIRNGMLNQDKLVKKEIENAVD